MVAFAKEYELKRKVVLNRLVLCVTLLLSSGARWCGSVRSSRCRSGCLGSLYTISTEKKIQATLQLLLLQSLRYRQE